ncbi:LexA family protein [Rummeliibacillus stabekisii]|uniref:XRE family transcriptional regulator n=1 Tax=Rummeliibacillus stabekisii TaxID=241244 RepID=A0A143HAI6_9BACL|nr:XRE family transcriptional regulator [Rummeliibacillus stabekisii]AMW98410.1 XRE family transcriptional regulator [Rummeliibacillus stabekisii]
MKEKQLNEILIKNLQYYFDRKGITQTDMARDLNFPETTVSNWMKGNTYPRPDKLQMMADYFNIKRSELTEEKPTNLIEINQDLVKIPVLGAIACGDPILAEENIIGYTYEVADTLPSGTVFALKAKGDSMEPTIPDGAIVLIRQQANIECGEIAAVRVNDDSEATLKRVKRQGETLFLMPDNPKHSAIIITEKNPATIIGKAVSFKVTL